MQIVYLALSSLSTRPAAAELADRATAQPFVSLRQQHHGGIFAKCLFVAAAVLSASGVAMVLFCLVAYVVGNMGAFPVVEAVARTEQSDDIDAYRYCERALYIVDAEGRIRYSQVAPFLHHIPDIYELLAALDRLQPSKEARPPRAAGASP